MTKAIVSKAGWGKPGYCKICAFEGVGDVNRMLEAGRNARQVNDWLKANYDFSVNRQVVYNHKREHLTHPKDRLVAHAEKQKALVKPKATNDEFLTAVRDIGFQRAQTNPEEITIDHALKAASIMAAKREKSTNVFIAMAQIVTAPRPDMDIVEGVAREVEEIE